MQLTVEMDDETCADIEAVAKSEHSSINSMAARALGNFRAPLNRPSQRIEDDNDMRGME